MFVGVNVGDEGLRCMCLVAWCFFLWRYFRCMKCFRAFVCGVNGCDCGFRHMLGVLGVLCVVML